MHSGVEAAAAASPTVSIKDSTQGKNAGSGLAYSVQTAIWNTHAHTHMQHARLLALDFLMK